MPATDSAMGPPPGSGSMSGAPDTKANETHGPAILGLLAFGMMSILFGLSQLPGPYGSGFDAKTPVGFYTIWTPGATVTASMGLLGGLVLVLVGLIILFRGWGTYWGVAFFGYGAFWAIWAGVSPVVNNHILYGFGTAGFAFVWLMFTLTFLLSSMKHGWMTFLFFLVLTLSYILLVVEFWQWGAWANGHPPSATIIPGTELAAIGGFWILSGFLAWYLGTARLTEMNYGRKLLPG